MYVANNYDNFNCLVEELGKSFLGTQDAAAAVDSVRTQI